MLHELTARQLSCWRNEICLFEGIDLQLCSGGALQISGANGTGKTSLLRILAGLTQPDNGEIFWDHERLSLQNRDLLYLGHQPGVKNGLTAAEDLHLSLALARLAPGSSLQAALAAVGLTPYANTLVSQLSAGQQRRVALARLFLSDAALWILDEPFTALDQQTVAIIEQRIVAHVQQQGMLIFTTHQAINLTGIPLQQLQLTGEMT